MKTEMLRSYVCKGNIITILKKGKKYGYLISKHTKNGQEIFGIYNSDIDFLLREDAESSAVKYIRELPEVK